MHRPLYEQLVLLQSRTAARLIGRPGQLHRAFASGKPPLDVSDSQIVQLASKPLHPLSLSDLVKHGRPPLTQSALLESARFTLSILPARLAHRLHAIQNLPYIVVSNPHISSIYRNYLHSLSTLLPFYEAGVHNAEDEAAFTDVLAELVQTHANTIPTLARGLKECGRYLGDGEGRIGAKFLDQHLRARIGTRLVAEQHLALHLASNPLPAEDGRLEQPQPSNFVGIIDTALSPVSVIRQCEYFVGELCELKYGVRPMVNIVGDVDARFAHVPTHIDYVLTELLKNSFRASIERGREMEPIEATIALGGTDTPEKGTVITGNVKDGGQEGVAISTPPSTTSLTIRIRDQGGGIAPEVLPHIWDYSFTTFDDERDTGGLSTLSNAGTGGSSIAGLGYGLPLGRAYAEFFGGELSVESLWHWGTDTYLRLKGLEMSVPEQDV